MSNMTQAFDVTFQPVAPFRSLADKYRSRFLDRATREGKVLALPRERARLDTLMQAVVRVNIYTGGVDYQTPDGVKCVSPGHCEICGQSDCGHQAHTALLIDRARAWQAEDQDDLQATYEAALGVR